jgi:tetratricopeptide (TPR) repeat protein
MLQLFDVDYRVREMIFTSLLIRYQETSLDPGYADIHNSLGLEIAKCYWLGFGTKRDETEARIWLSRTSLKTEFDSHIAAIKAALHGEYLWWTKFAQAMQVGHMQFTNDMQYYRDQRQVQQVLVVEHRELEDWSEVLGPSHFIVSQRGSMLFEKLGNLGRRVEALRLVQKLYDECKATLPSDHPRMSRLLGDLVKAHLTCNDAVEARRFLTILHPELSTSADPAAVMSQDSDRAFLQHMASYGLLAAIEDASGNSKEAVRLYGYIVPRTCKLLGSTNLQCIKLQYNLSLSCITLGQYAEAWQVIDPLYQIAVSNLGATHEISLLIDEKRIDLQYRLEQSRNWYGYWMSRRLRKGFDKAPIEAAQVTLGNSHPYTIEAMDRGIEALLGDVRFEEAIKLAQRALELVEGRSGSESREAQAQREKLVRIKRVAWWHWVFFRWGSWTPFMYEWKKKRNSLLGLQRRVFEPFELNLKLDPDYKAESEAAMGRSSV